MFADDEIDAIILGLRFVIQRGDEDLAVAAENAMAKIEAVLPKGNESGRAVAPLMAAPKSTGDDRNLAAIRAAIREERKILLRYKDKKDATTERTV